MFKRNSFIQTITICFIISFFQINLSAQVDNLYLGFNAGASNNSGSYNVFIGEEAGYSSMTANHNIIIGYQSAYNLLSGSYNVAIGHQAGYSSTTGNDNTYIGYQAGYSSTYSSNNTFIGKLAGYSNTSGGNNTFIGKEAGRYATTASHNTMAGLRAGTKNTTGDKNTFMGADAGHRNTTGYKNAFLGQQSGYDNTTGHHNTFVGDSAGVDNSTGIYNTCIGAGTGSAIEYTSFNTFVGAYAGSDNNRTALTTGATRNTYMGYLAGFTNREGSDNAGFGCLADFAPKGYYTNISNAVFMGAFTAAAADGVVVIGKSASGSGLNGIAIGHESTVTAPNAIAIGYQTSTGADNEVNIGNSAQTSIGGSVNWTATSDGRFKSDVRENIVGLDFINQLRPVTYFFDGKKVLEHIGQCVPNDLETALEDKNKIRYTGFIAQEVEQAALNATFDFSGVDVPNDSSLTDYYGLRYAEFVVPLVKSTQELSQKMITLRKENEQLARKSAQQKDLLAQYKTELEAILQQLESLEQTDVILVSE